MTTNFDQSTMKPDVILPYGQALQMTDLLTHMNNLLSVIKVRAEMLLLADVSEVIRPDLQQIYAAENEVSQMVQAIKIQLITAWSETG